MIRINLDPSLVKAASLGAPVELLDSATNERFFLLSSDQYHAIAASVCGEMDPREVYPMIDRLMAEDDANDPLFDSYQ